MPVRVLVTTMSFGRGVNVRGLHHCLVWDMPNSVQALVQMGAWSSACARPWSRLSHRKTCGIATAENRVRFLVDLYLFLNFQCLLLDLQFDWDEA